MVEVHAADIITPANVYTTDPLGLIAASIGGLAAPLFITISGWGSRRAMARRVNSERWELMKWVGVRFGFLMVGQLAVNLIASYVFNWYTPGILSLLAICAVLALPLARLSSRALIRLFVLLLLTPFLLASFSVIDGSWGAVTSAQTVVQWFGLLFIDGTFPLFPWLAFFVLGAIIHDAKSEDARILLTISASITAGVLFSALAKNQVWALPSGDAYLTFFPANSAFLIAATCGVLAAVLVLKKCGRQFFSKPATHSFLLIGRISLTIYLLHFIPLRIVAGLEFEPVSVGVAMVAVFGYTLLWWPLAIAHHRYASGLSFEALLSRLSKLTNTK
jgi:hypothetical protein